MRSIFILAFISLLNISASVYSQSTQLNIDVREPTIRDVFKLIESQSEFRFFYNDNFTDLNKKVTYHTPSARVEEILNTILAQSDMSYKVLENNLIVIAPTAELKQGNTVTGTVTDHDGEPIPGVNVVIKGSTTGVVTDIDGKFSINVPDKEAILAFSFVGYASQEMAVRDQTNINVTLQEDTREIEEVVVVGYGTQKKVNLTGAVAAVKVDEALANRSLTNVSTGLQGLLPGLAISQNSGMAGKNNVSMYIRGVGTVNNANPLVVVDGMPDVDINRIDMNDIESVSVLKDAASSAVYGSRAANGVILITTKSGKGSKTKVNFSGSYAISNPTNNIEFMADYPRAMTVHQRNTDVNTLPADYQFKNGTIDQWLALGMIDPLRYPNTDWWDWILRQGELQKYNISASGSNDKSNFFASAGYMKEKGLQINNDYSLYTARFNYDYKVRHNMNTGIKFNGNWSKYTYARADGFTATGGGDVWDMRFAIAGITPYDPVSGYFGGAMAYNDDAAAFNPYTEYINRLNYQNRQEANISSYLDWTPVKGLTARVDYALSYYNQFRWSANTPNKAYNFQTETFTARTYVADNAPVSNDTNTGYKTQLTGQLNYHVTIARRHELNILAIYSEEYWYSRSQAASRNDRLHPSLHEIDAALTDVQSNGGSSETEGLRSYIGRLNYSAYDKYLLELNFRVDGSSKFYPGNQYGFFPSAAVGWRFSEEDFVKNFTEQWLTSGKIRVSYGSLGNNSGVSRYEQKETLATYNYYLGSSVVKGFVNSKMINQDLSWETTTVFNAGLDLGFLRNRLTAELDYYDRLTTDMIRPSDFSIHLSGAYNPAPRRNIGNMRNRGIEANLTWQDRKGDFRYSVNINIAYNQNRLEKWNEYLSKGATSNGLTTYIDMPSAYVYAYEAIGIAQTWEDVYKATPQGASPGDILMKDVNGDGQITAEDMVAMPKHQTDRPHTNYGLNFHASWKGIDLSFMLQGGLGRKQFWLTQFNQGNLENSNRYASSWDHWNLPWSWDNRGGEWPRLGVAGRNRSNSTFWLDNLNYLRIKNVQLAYSLPKRWVDKIKIDNIRIYGSGENLFTITKYRGIDPEKQINVSDLYPLLKSFSFGINITF